MLGRPQPSLPPQQRLNQEAADPRVVMTGGSALVLVLVLVQRCTAGATSLRHMRPGRGLCAAARKARPSRQLQAGSPVTGIASVAATRCAPYASPASTPLIAARTSMNPTPSSIPATAAKRAMKAVEAMAQERFPQAAISWKTGREHGFELFELKVAGAKFPRVGRIVIVALTDEVASIRHMWPGRGVYMCSRMEDLGKYIKHGNL